mmetsp:Transcript_101041/g.314224  ORF Transcript_101041/g.314224 Transcript_101041/m.314224 type:complete len:441 (-) Transcript_101041:34-1356(-)
MVSLPSTPLLSRSLSEPKIPLRGRERSKALMSSLYDLRHAGNPNICAEKPRPKRTRPGCQACPCCAQNLPPVPSHTLNRNAGDELTLLEFTLVDCSDTPEQLRDGIELMQKGREASTELGGGRHPTSLNCDRVLQVVQRKLEVLEPLVLAIRQLEALCKKKEEVVEAIARGATAKEVGGDALRVTELCEESVHRRPHGAPQDADRFNWDAFVKSFGLPKQHLAFHQADAIIAREKDAWMDIVLPRAQGMVERERTSQDESPESPAAEAARALYALCDGMGIPGEHPKLIKTEMLADAQRALKLYRYARAEARDADGMTSHRELREIAERVNGNCLSAIRWGVKRNHPDMAKALGIAQTLRAEGVRQYALNLVAMRRSRLGEAEKAANDVEAAVKEAMKFGCLFDHVGIQESRKLALRLREEEGMRKRQSNAELRKSQVGG